MRTYLTYNIQLDQPVSVAVDELWQALTEPELLAGWLMSNDFVAREGHRFTFRAKRTIGWDGVVRCVVQRVTPLKQLSYSWISGADMPETTVTWSLRPEAGGSVLTFTHTGFRGLKYSLVGRMLRYGWRDMIGRRLPALLAAKQDFA